jgi:aquaporin TIP
MNIRALLAEFIGVFTLCFAGIGGIILNGGDIVAVALVHGLAIATMAAATGATSGGHLNPAVSIAFLLTGKQEVKDTLLYIVAQCLGAIVACGVLMSVFPADKLMAAVGMAGTPSVGAGFTGTNAVVAEIVATFFLMFVIWGTAVRKDGVGSIAPLLIGLTVALDIIAIGGVSGAAMNPARWLGPALVGGNFADAWIYWVGPIVGAALAALLWKHVLGDEGE